MREKQKKIQRQKRSKQQREITKGRKERKMKRIVGEITRLSVLSLRVSPSRPGNWGFLHQ